MVLCKGLILYKEVMAEDSSHVTMLRIIIIAVIIIILNLLCAHRCPEHSHDTH